MEYTDGATLFVGMPKHAQACLTLPNWFLDAFRLKDIMIMMITLYNLVGQLLHIKYSQNKDAADGYHLYFISLFIIHKFYIFSWNFSLLAIVINFGPIRVRNYWDNCEKRRCPLNHKQCKINFIDIRLRIRSNESRDHYHQYDNLVPSLRYGLSFWSCFSAKKSCFPAKLVGLYLFFKSIVIDLFRSKHASYTTTLFFSSNIFLFISTNNNLLYLVFLPKLIAYCCSCDLPLLAAY